MKIEQLLANAKSCVKKGEKEAATKLYSKVLEKYPQNREAKNGLKDLQTFSLKKIQPELPEDQANKLIALYSKAQFRDCLNKIRVLTLNYPNEAFLYKVSGACYSGLGQSDLAITCFERALELKPHDSEIYNNLGNLFKDCGHFDTAIDSYKEAIKFSPDYVEAYFNLGVVFNQLNQLEKAITYYEQALKINPSFSKAHNNLGIIFEKTGLLDSSIASYERVLKINPDNAKVANEIGKLQLKKGGMDEAIKSFRNALKIKSDYAEAINNLAEAYSKLGELTVAIKYYEQALKLNPKLIAIYSNIGVNYAKLGQINLAFHHYEKALSIDSDFAEARFNLSLLQIENNFIPEGFKNYEARWKSNNFPSHRRQFSIPRWVGESLLGKNILIWAEQGIGDEFQFSTLIPEFEKLGCKVGIECAAKVVEIFQWSFPWAEVRETGAIHCEGSEIYSQFDYQIPMGSLAPIFRTTLDDFRNFQKPYIPRLKEGELKVRDKLKLKEGQLLIGLSWRSSISSFHNLSVESLAPLATIKGAVFLAVQYDDCMPELDRVRTLGLSVHYYTDIDQKNDLASACALLGACDLVISASTSVFQQSGALGIPTLMFDAYKCKDKRIPWHPTVRVLELNPDDPPLLIKQILSEVPEIINWANQVTTSERFIKDKV
jgi:tetratricopeptide (TPR) repeat protein